MQALTPLDEHARQDKAQLVSIRKRNATDHPDLHGLAVAHENSLTNRISAAGPGLAGQVTTQLARRLLSFYESSSG